MKRLTLALAALMLAAPAFAGTLADGEGLPAHAASARYRLN